MRTGKRYFKGDVRERFWSAVDKSAGLDGCWPWLLGRSGGYGVFKLDGETVHAHRLACLWSHGRAPKIQGSRGTANTMHSCGNKLCCNPKHVKWASQRQLLVDWRRNGGCHGRQQLTADDVNKIRKLLADGLPVKAVAGMFPCGLRHIYRIRSGEAWAWL